ncbi:MAG: hypothetical protein WC682_00175 [Parcubacteria group bacterium]
MTFIVVTLRSKNISAVSTPDLKEVFIAMMQNSTIGSLWETALACLADSIVEMPNSIAGFNSMVQPSKNLIVKMPFLRIFTLAFRPSESLTVAMLFLKKYIATRMLHLKNSYAKRQHFQILMPLETMPLGWQFTTTRPAELHSP